MTRKLIAMSILVLLLLAGVFGMRRMESRAVPAVTKTTVTVTKPTNSVPVNETPKVAAPIAPLPSLIVIDPGHGGGDPGAPSVTGVPEKIITLAVATKLATDLRQDGYRVEMTRTTDTNYSLAHRLSYSLGSDKPAFYLSIHANSFAAASSVRGMEIHIYNPDKYANPKYPGIPAAANLSPQSKAIAQSIIKAIDQHPIGIPVRKLTGQSPGIRYDVDYLVRLNPAPSGLIELGYLTNPLDAKLLTEPATQTLYAADIAAGIAAIVPKLESTDGSSSGNAISGNASSGSTSQ